MIIRYQLNQDSYPAIPCVHDCVIKEVEIQNDFLSFFFEDDIRYHDSIKHLNPKARTLIIRYHLIDDFEVYVWKRRLLLTRRSGYLAVDGAKLIGMTSGRLEYLYHNVGYQSLVLKLWSSGSVIVDLMADYVEYEWIE